MAFITKSVTLLFLSGLLMLLLIVGSTMSASAASTRTSVPTKDGVKYQQIQGGHYGAHWYGRYYTEQYGVNRGIGGTVNTGKDIGEYGVNRGIGGTVNTGKDIGEYGVKHDVSVTEIPRQDIGEFTYTYYYVEYDNEGHDILRSVRCPGNEHCPGYVKG